ncbi:hypothetical protein [Photobacterium damselae]|uniref:hypothetical protein n=1 Tax=Photobacterium damselae TaxID=38293 RepID=UPI004068F1E8
MLDLNIKIPLLNASGLKIHPRPDYSSIDLKQIAMSVIRNKFKTGEQKDLLAFILDNLNPSLSTSINGELIVPLDELQNCPTWLFDMIVDVASNAMKSLSRNVSSWVKECQPEPPLQLGTLSIVLDSSGQKHFCKIVGYNTCAAEYELEFFDSPPESFAISIISNYESVFPASLLLDQNKEL